MYSFPLEVFGTLDQQGGASLDPRGLIGMICDITVYQRYKL